MRTFPSTSTVTPFRSGPVSFGRRPLSSFAGHLTCLALVKHEERDRALLVSDSGDPARAVWVPKAMLEIDRADRGRFIVAKMSHALANQKRLQVRFIDPARFVAEERDLLTDAVETAARARLRLRNYREPLAYPGRNAFA